MCIRDRLAFTIARRSLWSRNQAVLYEPSPRWRARSVAERPRLSVTAKKAARNQMVRGSLVESRIVPEVKLTCSWQSAHSQTTRRNVVPGGAALARLRTARTIRQPWSEAQRTHTKPSGAEQDPPRLARRCAASSG